MTDERPVTMAKPRPRAASPHQLHGRGSRGEAILTMATAQAPSRVPDQPCADCLDDSLAERGRLAVPGRVAFWLLALVFTVTMLGAR